MEWNKCGIYLRERLGIGFSVFYKANYHEIKDTPVNHEVNVFLLV